MQGAVEAVGDEGGSGPPLGGSRRDTALLFATRSIRLFGYGLVSIVLVLYLSALGLSAGRIGALLSLTLVGDTVVSLWLSTAADRLGRRRVLVAGALLLLAAGLTFCTSRHYALLLLAATIGVISPSGNEVGPFLPVEQAALSQVVSAGHRTGIFARYQLTGAIATAFGALVAGAAVDRLQHAGWARLDAFRAVLALYAVLGLVLAVSFACLTPAAEAPPTPARRTAPVRFGLHRSRPLVLRLSSLFALDAFGGGFVVQSVVVYWFHLRFGTTPSALGAIFFGANLLAGISALAAAPLARRIGLVETMVLTHIPSNVLLMVVPFMPSAAGAVAVLLARFSISQMDVPTRQAYVMAVVSPDERSAAAGVTGVARTAGASLSPSMAALLLSVPPLMNLPFVLSGSVKIVYDLLVWRGFRAVRPPE